TTSARRGRAYRMLAAHRCSSIDSTPAKFTIDASRRQSAHVTRVTAAQSRALRSEFASFESSRQAPASTVQFEPRPEKTVRLKSSDQKSAAEGKRSDAGRRVARQKVILLSTGPPAVVRPSIRLPSLVPPFIAWP